MSTNLAAEIETNYKTRNSILHMRLRNIAYKFEVGRNEAKALQIHAAFCRREAVFE